MSTIIYINGILYNDGKTEKITKISKSKNPLLLGRYWNDRIVGVYYDFFSGIIDDVKIYNRALGDDEIMQQAEMAGF